GVAGVGAGTVLGFVAKGKKDDSNANGHCNGNACDATGYPLRADAVTIGNVGTVVFVAGAALAATGAVLFFTAPTAAGAPRVVLTLALGPGAAFVGGRF
ncbi:MAG TPA: hypothetical protein VHB21_05140, partial [Minicystis sp.]|nr:hypothetical protein [Minicystis sp.]